MLTAVADRLRLEAAEWARRRQGADPLDLTLKRRRIYILPTRFGLVFAALVFAMLLGSLNYGASLGFALTFLLAGLGLVIMHHCHNNLLATEIRFAGVRAVFAGRTARFRIGLRNRSAAPRYDLELAQDGRCFGPVDVPAGGSSAIVIAKRAERRGWLDVGRFAVQTRHPGNLFRAWTWVHMDARCLVYPRPAPPGRPIPRVFAGHGSHARHDDGDSDFSGLRTASPADPPGRLAWKAYARSGQLLLKQFSGTDEQPCMLDWDDLRDVPPEARLEQLCRWCLDAAGELRSFGLRLPGRTIPLGRGQRHLHECLRALALFEPGAGA